MQTRKHPFILAALFVVVASSLSIARAQTPAPDRAYQQWTQAEAEKMLSTSPWASTQEKGVMLGVSADAGNVPESVTLRLRSSLHIRQAMLRLRQIKAKYDKMSDSDKASFDKKNQPLIDCPACVDNYVVALGPGPGSRRGVPSSLELMTLGEAKLNVRLANERGEERELVHFVPPKVQGDEAVFFFARTDDKGQPLVDQNTKKIVVTFTTKIFHSAVTDTKFEFDVSKMTANGTIDF